MESSSSPSSRRDDCQSPFLVMTDIVHDYTRVVTTTGETDDATVFRALECRSKEAYGCGETGARVVKGLTLFARAGTDDEIGTLCIRATPDVLSSVGSEIDDEAAEVYGRQVRLSARVSAVAGHVTVLRVSFLAKHCYGDFRSYHLVYDSAAASLSLLPLRPPHCRPVCTETPLIIHAEDKYSLVLMAQRSSIPDGSAEHTHPVFCLWSPPPSADNNNNNLLDTNKHPWELKGRSVAENAADRFNASVSFLCKGNAVWGDLRQGILYCDRSHLTDDGTTDQPVDLKLVPLPSECRTPYYPYPYDIMPVDRNMGCVGDLVWFVAIEPSHQRPGDTVVKVWTLDLKEESEEEWKLRKEFRMESVWVLPDGVLGAYGPPRTVPPVTVPEFPFVGRLDDGGGCGLYMMLPEPRGGGDGHANLVCIDLSSGAEGVRVLSSRRLTRPRLMDRAVVLDPGFLRRMSV